MPDPAVPSRQPVPEHGPLAPVHGLNREHTGQTADQEEERCSRHQRQVEQLSRRGSIIGLVAQRQEGSERVYRTVPFPRQGTAKRPALIASFQGCFLGFMRQCAVRRSACAVVMFCSPPSSSSGSICQP